MLYPFSPNGISQHEILLRSSCTRLGTGETVEVAKWWDNDFTTNDGAFKVVRGSSIFSKGSPIVYLFIEKDGTKKLVKQLMVGQDEFNIIIQQGCTLYIGQSTPVITRCYLVIDSYDIFYQPTFPRYQAEPRVIPQPSNPIVPPPPVVARTRPAGIIISVPSPSPRIVIKANDSVGSTVLPEDPIDHFGPYETFVLLSKTNELGQIEIYLGGDREPELLHTLPAGAVLMDGVLGINDFGPNGWISSVRYYVENIPGNPSSRVYSLKANSGSHDGGNFNVNTRPAVKDLIYYGNGFWAFPLRETLGRDEEYDYSGAFNTPDPNCDVTGSLDPVINSVETLADVYTTNVEGTEITRYQVKKTVTTQLLDYTQTCTQSFINGYTGLISFFSFGISNQVMTSSENSMYRTCSVDTVPGSMTTYPPGMGSGPTPSPGQTIIVETADGTCGVGDTGSSVSSREMVALDVLIGVNTFDGFSTSIAFDQSMPPAGTDINTTQTITPVLAGFGGTIYRQDITGSGVSPFDSTRLNVQYLGSTTGYFGTDQINLQTFIDSLDKKMILLYQNTIFALDLSARDTVDPGHDFVATGQFLELSNSLIDIQDRLIYGFGAEYTILSAASIPTSFSGGS